MKTTKWMMLVALVAPAAARASAEETADEAFARGQSALKSGRVHQACDAFEASEKLKATVDTELALADCFEKDGKPIAAARYYRMSSEKDVNASRKKKSLTKVAKLEAKAPKLHFKIDPKPAGLVLVVDGMTVANGDDLMVDVGPHEVIASAPGYQDARASVAIDRDGVTEDVAIKLGAKAGPMPAPEPPPAAKPAPAPAPAPAALQPEPASAAMPAEPAPMTEHAGGRGKTPGLVAGGVGVAALIGAAVFYELGSSHFDDEAKLCPGHLCASDADTAKANSLRDDARTDRGVAIGMGIGGAVLVAAGAYLLVTAHPEDSPVALHVDHHGGAVSYTLHF